MEKCTQWRNGRQTMCILSWRNMIYIYICIYMYIYIYMYTCIYVRVSWTCPESVLKVSCVCRCLCMCVYLSCTYTPASTTSTEGWIICRRVSGIHWEPQSGDGVIVQEHKLRQNQPEPQRDYNRKLTMHGLGLVTAADSLRQMNTNEWFAEAKLMSPERSNWISVDYPSNVSQTNLDTPLQKCGTDLLAEAHQVHQLLGSSSGWNGMEPKIGESPGVNDFRY